MYNPLIAMLEEASQNKTLHQSAEIFFLQLNDLKYNVGEKWSRYGTDFWKTTKDYSFRFQVKLGDQTVFTSNLQIYPKDGFKSYLYPALQVHNITEFDVKKIRGYENKLKKCLEVFSKKK